MALRMKGIDTTELRHRQLFSSALAGPILRHFLVHVLFNTIMEGYVMEIKSRLQLECVFELALLLYTLTLLRPDAKHTVT